MITKIALDFFLNLSRTAKITIWRHSKSIFYVKNHPNLFFLLKNINLGDQFLLMTFFDNFNFEKNNLFLGNTQLTKTKGKDK